MEYITGTAYFYREEYTVTPDVLIPRPETELLVERLVERLSKAAPYAVRQWVRTAAYAALFALCVLNLSGASFNPFIYFQF